MTQTNETKRQSAIEARVIRTDEHGTVKTDGTGIAQGLTLTFSNGQRLSILAGQLTDELKMEALVHGLKQKLVDAAAISRSAETGRSATVEDKYSAVKVVYDRLLNGAWNAPREGSAGPGTFLLRALCRVYPKKTADELREWLAAKSEAEQTALAANPKILAAIAEIKAEQVKGASEVDSDELLAGLDDA